MKYSILVIGCICIVLLAVMPAQAFTAKSLTLTLDQSGNADANMQYDLSIPEQAAFFFHVADLNSELKNSLESNLGHQVTVVKVDGSSADVIINSFATVTRENGTTVMTTPTFSFANAEEAVKNKWYSSFISADFAPQTTTITFPDGYPVTYNNLVSIPSASHQVA
ncbi:MAG: hypothetical protein LUQ31_08915 [Methanoregula sp.]|nr:hypothetical protein [Methanoregula sp.]